MLNLFFDGPRVVDRAVVRAASLGARDSLAGCEAAHTACQLFVPVESSSPEAMPGWVSALESGSSNTPDRLTVVTKPEALVDWLSLSFPRSKLEELRGLMRKWYGLSDRRAGVNHYDHRDVWESGAFLAFSEGRDECNLVLPGKAIAAGPELCELILALDRIGPAVGPVGGNPLDPQFLAGVSKGCRVDLSADLPRVMGLALMDRADVAIKADQVGRFRKCTPSFGEWQAGQVRGRTLYLGTRNSELMYRLYDKLLESGGKRDAVRCEAQCSGKYAVSAWMVVVQAAKRGLSALAEVIVSNVFGHMDFVDKIGAHGHCKRMRRLAWYSDFLKSLGAFAWDRLAVVRVASTALGKLGWMLRSVSRTFASLCDTYELHSGQDACDFAFVLSEAMVDRGRQRGARAFHAVTDVMAELGAFVADRVAVNAWAPIQIAGV